MVTPVVKKGTPSLQQAIHLAGHLNHHLFGHLHGACRGHIQRIGKHFSRLF